MREFFNFFEIKILYDFLIELFDSGIVYKDLYNLVMIVNLFFYGVVFFINILLNIFLIFEMEVVYDYD